MAGIFGSTILLKHIGQCCLIPKQRGQFDPLVRTPLPLSGSIIKASGHLEAKPNKGDKNGNTKTGSPTGLHQVVPHRENRNPQVSNQTPVRKLEQV